MFQRASVAQVCRYCNVIHSWRACPVEERADAAERACLDVAASWFARWASSYLASLAALAQAGVHIGAER